MSLLVEKTSDGIDHSMGIKYSYIVFVNIEECVSEWGCGICFYKCNNKNWSKTAVQIDSHTFRAEK